MQRRLGHAQTNYSTRCTSDVADVAFCLNAQASPAGPPQDTNETLPVHLEDSQYDGPDMSPIPCMRSLSSVSLSPNERPPLNRAAAHVKEEAGGDDVEEMHVKEEAGVDDVEGMALEEAEQDQECEEEGSDDDCQIEVPAHVDDLTEDGELHGAGADASLTPTEPEETPPALVDALAREVEVLSIDSGEEGGAPKDAYQVGKGAYASHVVVDALLLVPSCLAPHAVHMWGRLTKGGLWRSFQTCQSM